MSSVTSGPATAHNPGLARVDCGAHSSRITSVITLEDTARLIRGQALRSVTEAYREFVAGLPCGLCKTQGCQHCRKAKVQKAQDFPGVVVGGYMRRGALRARAFPNPHSQLVQVDLDLPRRHAELWPTVSAHPTVALAYTSPSGGLKALARVSPAPTTPDEHKAAWEVANRNIASDLGIDFAANIDPNVKFPNGLTFLCHDPNAVLNLNAVPVEWELTEREPRDKKPAMSSSPYTPTAEQPADLESALAYLAANRKQLDTTDSGRVCMCVGRGLLALGRTEQEYRDWLATAGCQCIVQMLKGWRRWTPQGDGHQSICGMAANHGWRRTHKGGEGTAKEAVRERTKALKGDLKDAELDKALAELADSHDLESDLNLALEGLQARCNDLPESARLPIEVTKAQDLHATVDLMWSAVISTLGTGPHATIFSRNSRPVTATRWRDKRRGLVHEIQDADPDQLQGISGRAVWWHGPPKFQKVVEGGLTPLSGESLDGIPAKIRQAEPLPHAAVVYLPPHTVKNRGKDVPIPECWGMWYKPAQHPLRDVTSKLFSMADGRDLQPLERVVDFPLLVRRGGDLTLVTTPGYCPEAAALITYKEAADAPLPRIGEAISTINHLFGGFPFDSDASRANLFAMLISYVIGPVCGAKPAFLGDKVTSRTGATLLMQTATIVMAGRPPVMAQAPSRGRESETEMQKNLLSAGLTGSPAVLMDNVAGLLDGTTWSAYVTSDVWNARLLGGNREGYVDRTTIVDMLTSNNLQFIKDTAARVRAIRLDAQRPDPENRQFAFEAKTEARENRPKYLRAVVALVRHWLNAGAPMRTEVGDFGVWKNLTRGILDHAGIAGFDAETKMPVAERVDDGGEAAFVNAWWSACGEKDVEASVLVDLAYGDQNGNGGTMDPPGDRTAYARSLSKSIGRMAGRYYALDDGQVVSVSGTPGDRTRRRVRTFRLLTGKK